MIMQTVDPLPFGKQSQQIRAQAASVLKRWGLQPRFKRWRLTQDPDTGMVVLFGILNNTYIATHTSTPFRDYFAPGLLNDLANAVQVQVVSCSSDGLRYAFVLDRGQVKALPTHVDYPFMQGDRLVARVVYPSKPAVDETAPPVSEDQTLVEEGVGAFLKVFDDMKKRDHLPLKHTPQNPPGVVLIDEDEFNQRVVAHEANRIRHQRVKDFLANSDG